MTTNDLVAIRARAAKATRGPWETRVAALVDYRRIVTTAGDGQHPIAGMSEPDDAAFIAAARTDVPKLCDDVEALLDELAAAREIIEWVYAWSQAYPLDVFPEPDKKRAHELLQAGGMSLDAVSASAIRHAVKSIGQDAANYLHSATEDADDRTT